MLNTRLNPKQNIMNDDNFSSFKSHFSSCFVWCYSLHNGTWWVYQLFNRQGINYPKEGAYGLDFFFVAVLINIIPAIK